MWSAWICMQSTDLIPIIPDWMSYPSFSWKPEDRLWKAHWRVYGWNNLHSVVLCQYVVNYAYSRHVNFPLKREGKIKGYNSRARSGRSIPSEGAESAPGFAAPLIAAYTFPDSQHSSIAVQADVLSLMPILPIFAFGEGILSREGSKVTGNCLSPRLGERGRLVSARKALEKYSTNKADSESRGGERARQHFIYHTCDALFWATKTQDRDTDGHGTAGGYVLRKRLGRIYI